MTEHTWAQIGQGAVFMLAALGLACIAYFMAKGLNQ